MNVTIVSTCYDLKASTFYCTLLFCFTTSLCPAKMIPINNAGGPSKTLKAGTGGEDVIRVICYYQWNYPSWMHVLVHYNTKSMLFLLLCVNLATISSDFKVPQVGWDITVTQLASNWFFWIATIHENCTFLTIMPPKIH